VGFRTPKEEAHEALRWRDFKTEQKLLFEKAGLAGFMADRSIFDEFLMEAFVEMPGGLADGVAFDLHDLQLEQREALGQLVALYLDRFPNPGLTGALEVLMPKHPSDSSGGRTDT
jgi:hypothetical protein